MDATAFDLNLRHLRALGSIVERGNMSAAAEMVGLSQPALTQGLAKLERQLAVSLFDRHASGVLPTDAGRVLAERAGAGFAILDAARRGAGRQGRGFAQPGQTIRTQLPKHGSRIQLMPIGHTLVRRPLRC